MFSQEEYAGLAKLVFNVLGNAYLPKKDLEELKMWEQMLMDKEFLKNCTASIVGKKKTIEYIIKREESGREISFKTTSKNEDFLIGYEGSAKLSYLLEGRRVDIYINPDTKKEVYFKIDISDEK